MLRLVARAAALAGCVFAVAVCGEQGRFTTTTTTGGGGGGGGGTVGNGVVTIQLPSKTTPEPVTVTDSVFVQVLLSDTKGVTSLVLTGTSVRGVPSLGTDTTVTRFTSRSVTLPKSTDTTITRYLRAVLTDSTAEFVTITATAIDAANDTSKDTVDIQVVNGPKVSVLQPAESSIAAVGKYVSIQVRGIHPLGVKVLGWRATGVVDTSHSHTYGPISGVLADTQTFTDSLLIPAATKTGSIVITPFATDSLNDPSGVAPGVTVLVQSVVTDTTPPLVRDTMPLRVEVGDSLTVTATDPSGISAVGFIVMDLAGDTLKDSSVTLGGTSTNVSQRFRLGLDTITTFPRVVTVEAFAVDAATAHNRGGSTTGATPVKWPAANQDTLTVVAGTTIALPQGGQFGDAVMNPNHNELYLTNTLFNQIEVFELNTNSFTAPIRVGSQPVGIALWPRDTLGDNADTVIVANSGGTNLSIVSVNPSARAEIQRHALANWLVETVTTEPTAAGGIQILTTDYDLADRPQYLATVCRHVTGTACDSVFAVYSTTPTAAQPGPFTSRGYLASENLSAPIAAGSGHLFYELATAGTDTLQIVAVRDTLPGQPIRDTILGAGIGYMVDLSTVAFQESTFVRNSGDHNHAVIGEGGYNQGFARALTLDGRKPIVPTVEGTLGECPLLNPNTSGVPAILGYLNCTQIDDHGMSPGVYVSDFLVNRAAQVLSVATNFNGGTNLVRADSIYAFDYTLKLTGLLPVPSGQPGMDFDPNNAFNADTRTSGTLNKNDRLVFAARPDAFIDVYDTYWYNEVTTIPIRDTIIGPIRVASIADTLVLVGVTSRGLVVVRLPAIVNQNLVRQPPSAVAQPVRVFLSTPKRSVRRRP